MSDAAPDLVLLPTPTASDHVPNRSESGSASTRSLATLAERITMSGPLDSAESSRLTECETVIERGLSTFMEVGAALQEIRDKRLYRATHDRFADYTRERWGLSVRYANRQIEAAKVAEKLGPIGPKNEAQARELAPLLDDPDRMRQAAELARASALGGQPTAAGYREAVNSYTRFLASMEPGSPEAVGTATEFPVAGAPDSPVIPVTVNENPMISIAFTLGSDADSVAEEIKTAWPEQVKAITDVIGDVAWVLGYDCPGCRAVERTA
jgi:hypothetical protein